MVKNWEDRAWGMNKDWQSMFLRSLQTLVRCCSLHLAPKWCSNFTFRFIPLTSLPSFSYWLLQDLDWVLLAPQTPHFRGSIFCSTLSRSLSSPCCAGCACWPQYSIVAVLGKNCIPNAPINIMPHNPSGLDAGLTENSASIVGNLITSDCIV